MILGLGCDIAQVSRFSRREDFINRFLKKHFTLNEINDIATRKENTSSEHLVAAIATRFAAKEAVSKALGSGFQGGITLKDIEITHDELGCPHATLYNKALSRAYLISNNAQFTIHITLSNEREYVNAVAVIESI